MYHLENIKRIFEHWQVNPRSVINWAEKGVIQPAQEPDNRGGKRVYDYRNLIQIAILVELSYYQLPLKLMKFILRHDKVKKAFREAEAKGDFNFVIWFRRQISLFPFKNGKRQVSTLGVECIPLNKFKPDIPKYVSGLHINVQDLKDCVDRFLD